MLRLSIELQRQTTVTKCNRVAGRQADPSREVLAGRPAVHGPMDKHESAPALEEIVDGRGPFCVPIAVLVERRHIRPLPLFRRWPLPCRRHFHVGRGSEQLSPRSLPCWIIVLARAMVLRSGDKQNADRPGFGRWL